MSTLGRLSRATQGLRGWTGGLYETPHRYFIAIQGFGEAVRTEVEGLIDLNFGSGNRAKGRRRDEEEEIMLLLAIEGLIDD